MPHNSGAVRGRRQGKIPQHGVGATVASIKKFAKLHPMLTFASAVEADRKTILFTLFANNAEPHALVKNDGTNIHRSP
jgi:hypothetical protein